MKSKKAFTLIELLVVISIIALLLSILMPALGRAKEMAAQVVCSSKLKNPHLAMFQYAQDYNGNMIGVDGWTTLLSKYNGNDDLAINTNAQGTDKGVASEKTTNNDSGMNGFEFSWSKVWTCPAAVKRDKPTHSAGNPNNLDMRTFAINRYIRWGDANGVYRDPPYPGNYIQKINSVKSSAETAMFFDAGWFHDQTIMTGYTRSYYFTAVDPSFGYVPRCYHFGKELVKIGTFYKGDILIYEDGQEQVAFFDGHVDSYKQRELPEERTGDFSSAQVSMFWYGGLW